MKGKYNMKIERGFRKKLDDIINTALPFEIKISTTGSDHYDSCCFGVDKNEKISDDRYTIFYNQINSPSNEITYYNKNGDDYYKINLNALPNNILKLLFTVSIDGNGTMGEILANRIELIQDGNVFLELDLRGTDFGSEKAIIDIEIYRKDVWRIAVVARGFNGGLGKLLESCGCEVSDDDTSSNSVQQDRTEEEYFTNQIMNKINLLKDKVNLEKHVVNLSKCVIDLSKKSGVNLGGVRAKVVVALDYSGSMRTLYRNGTVQQTLNKLVPLGLTFDDNGSIDFYLFETGHRKMDDLNLSNYENYVEDVILSSNYHMGQTNYAPVLNAIINGETKGIRLFNHKDKKQIVNNSELTFILFITDGANADKRETNSIIKKSSELNVFIQFIGIGDSEFHYLERLDNMTGRKRDNTGFSKMNNLTTVSDNELYNNVLKQFSNWLKGNQ